MTLFRKEASMMRRWFSQEGDSYLRLHQNEGNACSISPALWKEFLQKQTISPRYPEMQTEELTAAYAAFAGVQPENVLVTAGSGDGIRLIADAIDRSNKTFAIMSPSFFAFEYFFRGPGSKTHRVELNDKLQMERAELFRPEVLASDLLVLCNPNNPTGGLFPREWIADLLKSYKGLLLVDEAYIEYVDPSYGGSLAPLVRQHENLLVLRTMSKAWGLASARVGYIIAHKNMIDYFGKFQPPYCVPAMSQAISAFALTRCQAGMKGIVSSTNANREWMEKELARLPGVHVFPSFTNFVLFSHPDAMQMEQSFELEHKILVKSFAFPKAGPCVRLSISSDRDGLKRAIEAIRAKRLITA